MKVDLFVDRVNTTIWDWLLNAVHTYIAIHVRLHCVFWDKWLVDCGCCICLWSVSSLKSIYAVQSEISTPHLVPYICM